MLRTQSGQFFELSHWIERNWALTRKWLYAQTLHAGFTAEIPFEPTRRPIRLRSSRIKISVDNQGSKKFHVARLCEAFRQAGSRR